MNNNASATEAGKLFCELHKHFLLMKTLKDPVQVNLNQKEILILHTKWRDAACKEITEQLLPELLPLFGDHTYQIILFDAGDIFNISLAVLLTGYSVEAYETIRGDLYNLIEAYSETHTCSLSTLTASYPLSEEHPLYKKISTGTIIWQRPDSN